MADLRRLSKMLETEQNPMRVKRMWRMIDAAKRGDQGEKQPRLRLGIAAAAAACAMAALVVLWVWPASRGPLRLHGGDEIGNRYVAKRPLQRRFSDGSAFELAAGAVRLVENTTGRIAFAVDNGEVRFDVRPGGPRVWRVDCHGVSITVVGTAFLCKADKEKVIVAVERGAVLVAGRGIASGGQRLEAGDEVEVAIDMEKERRPVKPIMNVVEMKADGFDGSVVETPDPSEPAERERARSLQGKAKSGWRRHAQAGDFNAAFDQLGASRVATLTERSTDVDELFALADVARLSGHPVDAVGPLETIIRKFSQNSRAGLAAYTLGRLYLERLNSPIRAASAFERSLALGLPVALREAATVKRINAVSRYDKPQTKKLVAEYLTTYPNGRYRDKVEQWITE